MLSNWGDKISMSRHVDINENLQQAYMMLLNSKCHLRNVKENTFMKSIELNDLCSNISSLENRLYELIRFFEQLNYGDDVDDD